MPLERLSFDPSPAPFPVYADPAADLLGAHAGGPETRDALVAHVLAVLSGYAYSDTATFALMASRLGLRGVCVRVSQTVDAMFIFSTAYVLQSRCGRLGILCYRGTEPANLGNWLGDADVGAQLLELDGARLSVHAGFYRNVRATRVQVLQLLHAAADGFSLEGDGVRVEPLQALYVTGHSLGGAMASLLALDLLARAEDRPLLQRLRAVYTFGQPLAVAGPLPPAAAPVAARVFRHVHARDVVPSLPPGAWGHLEHFGHEYHGAGGDWHRRESATTQLASLREVSRSLLGSFAPLRPRVAPRFTIRDHGPHHYIAALRPPGRVTEFGDRP